MKEKRPRSPSALLSSQKAFSLDPYIWTKARSASGSASSRLTRNCGEAARGSIVWLAVSITSRYPAVSAAPHADPGKGVFETMLVIDGQPVELDAHLEL